MRGEDTGAGGVPLSVWLAIGTLVVTASGTFLWWLWLRFLARIDAIKDDLYGKEGVVAALNLSMDGIRSRYGEFVSQEDFDVQLSHLDGHIRELQREGAAREIRILEAIEKRDERDREDNRMLRGDLTAITQRIDNIFSNKNKVVR